MCGVFCFYSVQAEPLKVALELGEEREAYRIFESALLNALQPNQDIRILPSGSAAQADLIVAVGSRAAGSYSSSSIPILHVMVSRAGLEKFRSDGKQQSSSVFMDQPIKRQFSLLRAAFPQAKSIGVLISRQSAELTAVKQLSAASGLSLHIGNVSAPEQLAKTLSDLLADSDVLLVLPDAGVYRSDTIRNILLETYRQHVPMIGLSQNYVRAGALCAVYSTPLQMAKQAAQMVSQFARTGKLPDYQYPHEFEVAVNTQVARSLGLTIKSAEQLRSEIGGEP